MTLLMTQLMTQLLTKVMTQLMTFDLAVNMFVVSSINLEPQNN